jgi:hypothetical protein
MRAGYSTPAHIRPLLTDLKRWWLAATRFEVFAVVEEASQHGTLHLRERWCRVCPSEGSSVASGSLTKFRHVQDLTCWAPYPRGNRGASLNEGDHHCPVLTTGHEIGSSIDGVDQPSSLPL